MDKSAAIETMESLVAKGWTFDLNLDEDGWRCEIVGAGLAHGMGCGKVFPDAVELAIKNASSMEDDPAVIIAKYEAGIRSALAAAFGDIKFRIEAVGREYEWGPKRIQITLEANADPRTLVDREGEFYKNWLVGQPMEILSPLMLHFEWPEEKAVA